VNADLGIAENVNEGVDRDSQRPILLTAQDVAERLRVPASWVYAETRAGRIPHVRLGPRYRRYRLEAIEAWVRELERGPTPYRKYRPSSGGLEGRGRPSGTQPDG
jgi:excisionase family DNA binding protein